MKNLIVLIIFLVLILGIIALIILPKEGAEEKLGKEVLISETEKEQIEAWIEANDLNQYGDPKDTVYTGGTPLFNEKTGQTIDRYEYILRKHPDRPWRR